jgi:hypothetical protein
VRVNVGKTRTFHCCSTNAPNAMIDSGLRIARIAMASPLVPGVGVNEFVV